MIKHGVSSINILSGTYERWGDYTGNQRKYNEPGTVWISGMWCYKTGPTSKLGTQIAELTSPRLENPAVIEGDKIVASLYPNPFNQYFSMEFTLDESQHLMVGLYDLNGRQIRSFYKGIVEKGKNILAFNTSPLRQGLYIISIRDENGKVLFSSKVAAMEE